MKSIDIPVNGKKIGTLLEQIEKKVEIFQYRNVIILKVILYKANSPHLLQLNPGIAFSKKFKKRHFFPSIRVMRHLYQFSISCGKSEGKNCLNIKHIL